MEEEDRRLGSREGRGEGNVVWGWVEEQGEWLEEEGTSDSWRLGCGGIQVDCAQTHSIPNYPGDFFILVFSDGGRVVFFFSFADTVVSLLIKTINK